MKIKIEIDCSPYDTIRAELDVDEQILMIPRMEEELGKAIGGIATFAQAIDAFSDAIR